MDDQPGSPLEPVAEPPHDRMPHAHTIVLVTFFILTGFSGVTAWALYSRFDATILGSLLQTWNNLAVAAGAFWLGSSLGGKMKR